MGTPETSREPCPDRILDDLGGAFAMGAVGGSVFHFIKGAYNSPKGERFLGGASTVRMSAPRTGGGFAVWGGLFSTFDCGMVYIRQKEDPWNSIFAGAATGGFLQMRQGLRSSARSAAFGGVLLALIEGAGIMFNRVLSPPPQIMYDDPGMAGAGMGGGAGAPQMGGYGYAQTGAGAGGSEQGSQSGGFFGGWFGDGGEGKKEESGSSSGGGESVLESFDTPTPMPNFDYK
ncbi:mitochondrial import inner membrane translocase subunit TIM17-2-like [Chenopodium quinoa]|uniref:mitochondrial import inner membrane translocase subunit TIM17-2-like n=1 Tax=Chenopodium quinoa TaxID=63459 RepID=UPI000B77577D|nr:mitochondrial import inner membrane translocase subunit TIM17-2-like [Chenopodium quinoa]